MLQENNSIRARATAIGAAALVLYLALSTIVIVHLPNHAVDGWPVIAASAALLMVAGNRRAFALGLGAESALHLSAAPAIFFGSVLLVPPAMVPLLALGQIVPGRHWARGATGAFMYVAGAAGALFAAQVAATSAAPMSVGAALVASYVSAAAAWCIVGAFLSTLLCRVLLGMPMRLSPTLNVAAQIPVVVGVALGAAGAGLLRYSPWNAALVALLVWVNYQYIAAHGAASDARADDKTGLPRVSEFMRAAQREVSRAARSGHPVSVLMLDLDHFRAVNTRHGHLAGDAVLFEVSQRLRTSLRLSDVAARFGGEEFSILLPDTTGNQATDIAERVRSAIASVAIPIGEASVAVTISVGVTEHVPHELISETLRRADQALYDAKAAGRNRVAARLPSPSLH